MSVCSFLLVESSTADDLLELLASIHKIVPYELMKQGLRIVNPALAIKVIVNIIFGQPRACPPPPHY